MLLTKGWMETRWRLLSAAVYSLIFIALNYRSAKPPEARTLLTALGLILTYGVLVLAGSGVKSQAPVGFPEGLAGSTQFTLALPVSRLRLITVRAVLGLCEVLALMVLIACLAWGLFPSVRASVTG